jgi:hypothetical protein
MTDTDETNTLAELRATVRERGGGRRSPLFQWMYRNHDALLEMLSEVRPNWPRVTAVLIECGFTGPDGRPLQPETVRKLWLRVRRRHEGTGRQESEAHRETRDQCAGRDGGTGGCGNNQHHTPAPSRGSPEMPGGQPERRRMTCSPPPRWGINRLSAAAGSAKLRLKRPAMMRLQLRVWGDTGAVTATLIAPGRGRYGDG